MLQVPLDPPTDFTIQTDNGQVRLTWTDPLDKYATPEGEQAGDPDQLVSVWSYTAIVRKEGSAPTGIHDGILVAESQVHNQYQSSPYIDTGLTNGVTYYYGLFAINESGIASEGAIKDVTPVVGVAISTFPVGTIIKINENGAPTEWIIVNQGIPIDNDVFDSFSYSSNGDGFNGTWILRKEPFAQMPFYQGEDDRTRYSISTVKKYLCSDYLTRFETDILNLIHQCTPRAYSDMYMYPEEYLQKFFLLGAKEVGMDCWAACPDDGYMLSYFLRGDIGYSEDPEPPARRVAYANGSPVQWWLRSGDSNDVWTVTNQGAHSCIDWTSRSYWVRPACVIKFDSFIDADLNLIVDN